MIELWKQVPGTDGWYWASTEGRIRRIAGLMPGYKRPDGERILKATPTGDGYPQVGVFGKMQYVHILVAKTFIGPRPGKMQVRHLDDIKGNNRPSNLCYGTARDNALDVTRLGGRAKRSAARAADIVAELRAKSAWTHAEIRDMADRFGVCAMTVRRIWKGEVWKGVL